MKMFVDRSLLVFIAIEIVNNLAISDMERKCYF